MNYLKDCPKEYCSSGMAIHFAFLVQKITIKKNYDEISMLTLTYIYLCNFLVEEITV